MAHCTKSPPGVLWIAPPAVISGIGYLAGPKTKSGRVVPWGARRLCLHCIYIMVYINIRYTILFITINKYIYIYIYYTPNQYIPRHSLAASVLPSLAPIDMTKEKKPEGIRGHKQPKKHADTTNTSTGICHSSMSSKNNQDPVTLEVQRVYIYIYIFLDLFFKKTLSVGPAYK